MDCGDAFDLLRKYNLMEEAKIECKRRKIDEAPYGMIGYNKIYADFLNKKWVEFRDEILTKQKNMKKCCNSNALELSNTPHEGCYFNRISFEKKGWCDKCALGNEITASEKEMQ